MSVYWFCGDVIRQLIKLYFDTRQEQFRHHSHARRLRNLNLVTCGLSPMFVLPLCVDFAGR